jgi:flavin-binding protein dodecin
MEHLMRQEQIQHDAPAGSGLAIEASSPYSFEDAIDLAMEQAVQQCRSVRGAWLEEQRVVIEDGRIEAFRICLRLPTSN